MNIKSCIFKWYHLCSKYDRLAKSNCLLRDGRAQLKSDESLREVRLVVLLHIEQNLASLVVELFHIDLVLVHRQYLAQCSAAGHG